MMKLALVTSNVWPSSVSVEAQYSIWNQVTASEAEQAATAAAITAYRARGHRRTSSAAPHASMIVKPIMGT